MKGRFPQAVFIALCLLALVGLIRAALIDYRALDTNTLSTNGGIVSVRNLTNFGGGATSVFITNLYVEQFFTTNLTVNNITNLNTFVTSNLITTNITNFNTFVTGNTFTTNLTVLNNEYVSNIFVTNIFSETIIVTNLYATTIFSGSLIWTNDPATGTTYPMLGTNVVAVDSLISTNSVTVGPGSATGGRIDFGDGGGDTFTLSTPALPSSWTNFWPQANGSVSNVLTMGTNGQWYWGAGGGGGGGDTVWTNDAGTGTTHAILGTNVVAAEALIATNGFALKTGGTAGYGLISDADGDGAWGTNFSQVNVTNLTIQNNYTFKGATVTNLVQGSGTIGRLTKFVTTNTIGDSIISESGTNDTVNGNIAVTGVVNLSNKRPSLTATNEPTTGFYRAAANEWHWDSGTTPIIALRTEGLSIGGSYLMGGIIDATSSVNDAYLSRQGADLWQLGLNTNNQTFRATPAVGTDKSGGDFLIAAGRSTGTGTGGAVHLQTAGTGGASSSTVNSLVSRFVVTGGNQSTASIQTGTNATMAKVGGTLKVDTTTTGNVGGGTDNLISYTVPANVLASNGDHLEFRVAGTFAATVNPKTLSVVYGGTTILTTTSLVLNNLDWKGHGVIVRTGATTQKATVEFTVGGTLLSAINGTITDYTTPGETLSGTVVFKCTASDDGGVPADNAVVQEMMVLKWFPNGN